MRTVTLPEAVPRTSPKQFQCHRCDEPVDPVRAVAKVVGGRIVRVCDACSLRPAGLQRGVVESATSSALAPSESDVSPSCVATDAGASFAPRAIKRGSRLSSLRVLLGAVGVGAVAIATLAFQSANSAPRMSAVMPTLGPIVEVRPKTELLSLTTEPMELVEPSSELLAEGDSWVHPVVDSEEQVPVKRTRLFKAERPGERPDECGLGHCGVDLDAPRGTPVVAIRDGIIEKVIKDSDAKGGRYVWIFHEDIGLRTEYFHFDRIAPDIEAGDPVQAGQWLGTLGRTGIEHSQPHLHFTVRDASQELRYIDPLPWLEKASILPLLEMRLASSD